MYAGLDISNTCTGITIFDIAGKHIETVVINFEKEYKKNNKRWQELLNVQPLNSERAFEFARYKFYAGRIIKKMIEHKIKLAVIEGYSYAGSKAYLSHEAGGVIKTMMIQQGIRWIEIAPTSLKKFATGVGKADKDVVILRVFKNWGFDPEDYGIDSDEASDASDSYAIGKVCYHLFSGDVNGLNKKQSEVVNLLLDKFNKVYKAPWEKIKVDKASNKKGKKQ